MKVTSIRDLPVFQAVELTITIESQEELDALFCHFQYSPTNDFLREKGVIADAIAIRLKNHGATTSNFWSEYLKAVDI